MIMIIAFKFCTYCPVVFKMYCDSVIIKGLLNMNFLLSIEILIKEIVLPENFRKGGC